MAIKTALPDEVTFQFSRHNMAKFRHLWKKQYACGIGGLSEASPEPFFCSFQRKFVWNFYTESTWTCSIKFLCLFWKMKCLLSCYYNKMARTGTNTFHWKFWRKYIGRNKPIPPFHYSTAGGQSLCEHDHTP